MGTKHGNGDHIERYKEFVKNTTKRREPANNKPTEDEIRQRAKEFYDRLFDEMEAQGKTVMALCEATGVLRQTFDAWVLRTTIPSIDNVYRISKYLNTTMDFLWGGSEGAMTPGLSLNRQRLIKLATEHESDEEIDLVFRSLLILLDSNTRIITD